MKVLIVSLSNKGGGASRAVNNLYLGLKEKGVKVELLITEGMPAEGVRVVNNTPIKKFTFRLKNLLIRLFLKNINNPSRDYRSINIFPSSLLKKINNSDADLVHLHWIGAEMISIKQISKIQKRIIWTLHDSWPLLGCNHIDPNDYNKLANKNDILEIITLRRKIRLLKSKEIVFTSPSNWLCNRYNNSFYNKKTSKCIVIPNIFDFNDWKPIDKNLTHKLNKLPTNKTYILFGANGADVSYNKGAEFVKYLIEKLNPDEFQFIVFGNDKNSSFAKYANVSLFGKIKDDKKLRNLYSLANITLLPSRSENFPYTALESIACGTPVLAFNTGGLSDIIKHKKNGYLAEKFKLESLVLGIQWLISNKLEDVDKTLYQFDKTKVLQQYIDTYLQEMDNI